MAALGIVFSFIHSSTAVLAPWHRFSVPLVEHLATAAVTKDGDALASQIIGFAHLSGCSSRFRDHCIGAVVCDYTIFYELSHLLLRHYPGQIYFSRMMQSTFFHQDRPKRFILAPVISLP
jgi:hypothetical protein